METSSELPANELQQNLAKKFATITTRLRSKTSDDIPPNIKSMNTKAAYLVDTYHEVVERTLRGLEPNQIEAFAKKSVKDLLEFEGQFSIPLRDHEEFSRFRDKINTKKESLIIEHVNENEGDGDIMCIPESGGNSWTSELKLVGLITPIHI
ncbi:hypothetical protein H0H92_001365 [Tricholoma furcatifolium]|nr:hypothetical protein H0H92_001365 [Tricholoma furcatifolium]